MAMNIFKVGPPKKSTNPKATSGSGLRITLKAKSRLPHSALVDKENTQPHQGSESQSPIRQSSPDSQSPTSNEGSTAFTAVLQRMEQMEAQLRKEQEEKQKLMAAIELFQARERDKGGQEGNTEPEDESINWQKKYMELQKSVSESHSTDDNPANEDMIPHPTGTAGKDWTLQIEMRLSGSSKRDAKYAALLRALRDLVHNAGVNWEAGWKEIPTADKSKLFQVACERHPILKRYVNDWATAEIVKQYLKNKCAYHYNNGWLEVPEKYAYLKENSSKRNPAGSRKKHAKAQIAAKKKAKNIEVRIHRRKDLAEVEMDHGNSEEEDDAETNNEL